MAAHYVAVVDIIVAVAIGVAFVDLGQERSFRNVVGWRISSARTGIKRARIVCIVVVVVVVAAAAAAVVAYIGMVVINGIIIDWSLGVDRCGQAVLFLLPSYSHSVYGRARAVEVESGLR